MISLRHQVNHERAMHTPIKTIILFPCSIFTHFHLFLNRLRQLEIHASISLIPSCPVSIFFFSMFTNRSSVAGYSCNGTDQF